MTIVYWRIELSKNLEFEIRDTRAVSSLIRGMKIFNFSDLVSYVQHLPYGRTISSDILAVVWENKGTCSSKHRLLAAVAEENARHDIELVVGVYMMCEENTPGVGVILSNTGVASIPEAHCYLRHENVRYDYTGLQAFGVSPFESLVSEHVTTSAELPHFKLALHKEVMANWALERDLSFFETWKVREKCIQRLSESPFGKK